jgi:hypothetical protein
MKKIGFFVAFLLICAGCLLAMLKTLVLGLFGKYDRMLEGGRTLSRSCAYLFGYSGEYSLSAESALNHTKMEKVGDFLLGKGHCESEAKIEGLIK